MYRADEGGRLAVVPRFTSDRVPRRVEEAVEAVGADLECFARFLNGHREEVGAVPLFEHAFVVERRKGQRPVASVRGRDRHVSVGETRLGKHAPARNEPRQRVRLETRARERKNDELRRSGSLVQKAPEFRRYESRLSLALPQDADDAVRVLLRPQAVESRFDATLTDDRDSNSRPQRRRFIRWRKGLPPFREGLEGSAAREDFVEQTPADPF